MSFEFMVDIEADGPAPGLYSMVSFGVVEMTPDGWGRTFYGQVAPIVEEYIPEALAVSNHTREEHVSFESPEVVMKRFDAWIRGIVGNSRAHFFSDNPAFDWQFMNYYLHRFTGDNVFGHSARRIGDIYAGAVRDFYTRPNWKKWKKTPHTHHPLDDAKGNAEAYAEMVRRFHRT